MSITSINRFENLSPIDQIMDFLGEIEAPTEVRDLLKDTIRPAPVPLVITSETIEKCRKFVVANWDRIQEMQDDKQLHFFTSTECTVFSNTDMPEVILKVMLDEEAEKRKVNVDRTRKIFAERHFCYCYAPQTELAKLPGKYTLLVAEKVPGEATDESLA